MHKEKVDHTDRHGPIPKISLKTQSQIGSWVCKNCPLGHEYKYFIDDRPYCDDAATNSCNKRYSEVSGYRSGEINVVYYHSNGEVDNGKRLRPSTKISE